MKFNLQIIASILAFFIGYELLLPTSTEGSVWFQGPHFNPPYLISRMEIIKGFFIKDLIAIIYISLNFYLRKQFKFNSFLNKIKNIYFSIFFYGLIIALFSEHIYDVFENIRLLIILLSLLCFYYSDKNKTLLAFAIGLVVSGLINLYISYTFNLYGLKPIFFLVNQNGPGPIAAVLLHLFIGYRRSLWFYKLFNLVLISIVILSLSKIAYLIFILYLIRYIFTQDLKYKKLIILSMFIIGVVFSSVITSIFEVKFSEGFSIIDQDGGDQTRLAYYRSQIEIFQEKPLGVSYSGYYNAIKQTNDFKNGIITETDPERANPHSTFLYYISSHGIFGIFILFYFIFMLQFSNYPTKNIFTNLSVVIFLSTIPFFFVSYFFLLPFILLNKE